LRQISFALSAICWWVGRDALSAFELILVLGDDSDLLGLDIEAVRLLRPAEAALLPEAFVPGLLFVLAISNLLSILNPDKSSVLKTLLL
jgi:hypothetical protein